MKIGANGELSVFREVTDGHWLALDEQGNFARSAPRNFQRITADGVAPALIFAGGGAPLAVAADGALYYGSNETNGDPGGLNLARVWPDGRQSLVSGRVREILHEWDDGITGVAPGPGRSVYAATWTGVMKVGLDGTATVVSHPVVVPDCDPDPADHKATSRLPYLRGLAVLEDGTVYAAATSCHAVVRIGPRGDVTAVLKSERPWSPTGVAARGGNLYVLEYANANGPATEGWRPRVRRIDSSGQVSTVVTVR
jgi:hypothetical protein